MTPADVPSNAGLWMWLLGILGSLTVLGMGAWLTAINSKLGKIADAITGHAVDLSALKVRLESVEKEHATSARADVLDRMDRELGRRLSGLEDGVARMHVRMDQVSTASASASAAAATAATVASTAAAAAAATASTAAAGAAAHVAKEFTATLLRERGKPS